jgi:tetratricopeptide (TPR) repeat protein
VYTPENAPERLTNRQLGRDARAPFALGVLADELRERGNYAQAEACYRKAMDLAREQNVCNGSLADMKIALGQVLLVQRKLRQAERCLREAIELASCGSVHPQLYQSARDELAYVVSAKRRLWKKIGLATAAFLLSVGILLATMGVPESVTEQFRARGINEVLTSQAFDAFNQGEYSIAREHARTCIRYFSNDAERLQKRLTQETTEAFPVGHVPGPMKQHILQNGLLNDVGTCLWLSGRCSQQLGDIEEARKAYQQAGEFIYARCWDPKAQIFWSPAQQAADDLNALSKVSRSAKD